MNRNLMLLALAATLAATAPAPARAQNVIEKVKSFLKAGTELPENVWAVTPEEEVQDVVFLGETRPLVLRLHVQVEGKGFRTAWDDFARKLYDYLDRDGDGTLSKDEAERGSVLQMIQNGFNGGFDPNARLNLDTGPADGKVSMAELMKFLKASFGPFQIRPGQPPDARAESMFRRIDRDGDGKLNSTELAEASKTLLSADADDDEIVVAAELTPYQNPFYGRRIVQDGSMNAANAEGFPFVAPMPEEPPDAFAKRLLKRYDNGGPKKAARARDGKLERAEIALKPADFDRADSDSDGKLDLVELGRLRKTLPPDLEVAANFQPNRAVTFETVDERGNPAPPPEGVTRAGGQGPSFRGMDSPPSANGSGFQIELDGVKIVVRANVNGNDVKQYYESQFKAADGDNNKYLEKKEADGNFPFGQLFAVMDRDGDGKVFLEEVSAFADRQQDASRSRTTVVATDQGRALFEAVDADHDGRLSTRELRKAAQGLRPVDRDGDGRVALSEVPHHYVVVIGRGATGYPFGDDSTVVTFPGQGTPRGTPAQGAPSWFIKMDRNNDGDVSRREFLGPAADFDRLDTDHDGLLDAAEAVFPP